MSNEWFHFSVTDEDEVITVRLNPKSFKGVSMKIPKGTDPDLAISNIRTALMDSVISAVNDDKIRKALVQE